MRTPRRVVVLLALPALAACGGGGPRIPSDPPESAAAFTSFVPRSLPSEGRLPYTIGGRGFGPTGSQVQVRFDAGQPAFLGATQTVFTANATVISSDEIQGSAPLFGVQRKVPVSVTLVLTDGTILPYTSPLIGTVEITHPNVGYEDGIFNKGLTSTPGPGEVLTLITEGVTDPELPLGVRLQARIATPFADGESDSLTLEGVWIPPATIRAVLPPFTPTEAFTVDLEVHFASGAVAGGLWLDLAPGVRVQAWDTGGTDLFGSSCATFKGRAAFGAPWNDSVYVHERDDGSWPYTARLIGTNTTTGDAFGASVDLSGDAAVVGATGRGAAYVFRKGATSWAQEQEIRDPTWTYGVGGDVAIDGDVLAIAQHASLARVQVHRRVGGTWSLWTTYQGGDTVEGDGFGRRVAVNELMRALAVGSPYDDDRGTDSGSVYVTEEYGGGWSPTKLVPADLTPGDNFGFDVAMGAYLLAVGAPGDTAGSSSGSVFVFQRLGSSWVQEANLLPPAGASGRIFGYAVALDGQRLVVGAPSNGAAHGAVYVYDRAGGSWPLVATLTAWWPSPYATGLGSSVDCQGDDVVTGAPDSDAKGSGCIY